MSKLLPARAAASNEHRARRKTNAVEATQWRGHRQPTPRLKRYYPAKRVASQLGRTETVPFCVASCVCQLRNEH